jgi:hypothetical protein
MAPQGSLLVSYLYAFPEIDMGTGARRKLPAGARGKGKMKAKAKAKPKPKPRSRGKKMAAAAEVAAAGNAEDAEDMVQDQFKRRLLVVRGLTSASTVGDVSACIYRELRVPPNHAELSVLVRSLREDVRRASAADADGGASEKPTWSRQMLGEIGVVLHPESAVTAATPAFHLRTRIAVKDYAPGGQFFETYREDGGYRRETLSQALSKSWSVQLVLWAFNKHWITRFALITFAITSLVGLAQQVNALFGLR